MKHVKTVAGCLSKFNGQLSCDERCDIVSPLSVGRHIGSPLNHADSLIHAFLVFCVDCDQPTGSVENGFKCFPFIDQQRPRGGAIRLISIERGYDPKQFALMPFGGGGALHSGAMMRDIGLGAAIVPRYPGVNSALGCVMSDLRHDEVRTMNLMLDELNCSHLKELIQTITESSKKLIERSKASLKSVKTEIELDMLYVGQSHSVSVPLTADIDSLTIDAIKKSFIEVYSQNYSRPLSGIPIRILNLRLSVIGIRPAVDLKILAKGNRAKKIEECLLAEQKIYAEGTWHNAQIIDRLRLPEGSLIHGPALLVQGDATIYVDPKITARTDKFGNIIMTEEN